MDKIVGLRRLLHENAELSLREERTIDIITDFIRENTPLTPIVEEGCVYAVYNPNGKVTIALRADMDALPISEAPKEYASLNREVAHLCGHDGHTAALCGAMVDIVEKGCDNRIIFIFQKGEEIGAGGQVATEILKRLGTDYVYGWHNIPGFKQGAVLIRENTFSCGSRGIIIDYEGRSAHAAYPETGISPGTAVRDMLTFVEELNHRATKGLLHCTLVGIDCGGEDFGISAYRGRLMLTLRGEHPKEYASALKDIEERARELAVREGLRCTIDYRDVFPPTVNHPEVVRVLEQVCRENNIPVDRPKEPFRWSEDFGHYLQDIKGCYFGIGDGEWADLHTPDYDFPEDIIPTAVKVMSALARRKYCG